MYSSNFSIVNGELQTDRGSGPIIKGLLTAIRLTKVTIGVLLGEIIKEFMV